MSKGKIIVSTVFAVLAFMVGKVIFQHYTSDAQKIARDMARLSQSQPARFLNDFDYVCFNYDNYLAHSEFEAERKRLNKQFNIPSDYGACGNPPASSDISGIVGLAKDDTFRCVEIYIPAFVTTADRAMCMLSNRLRIQRKVFTTPTVQPGRSWHGTPGSEYYQIDETEP